MMTPEQFDREMTYHITLCIAKAMLQKGLITVHEFKIINQMLLEKYRPLIALCS
ncbi:SHOCT domain-containing protein [Desulfosporosinus sp. FKB]|uniref:SHOCT domain-containing protein n=1 Tax=Desulfosporosinus sp. FKB TaxID=1969835 RepID=UPI001482D1EA|nr:SHOCT domain-containing protein [Desulfosporosinus sp. FKB]